MDQDELDSLARGIDAAASDLPDLGLHYILIGQTVLPATLGQWAMFRQNPDNRRVALSRVGPYVISTVFLGLDRNFHRLITGQGEPLLFESMAFITHPNGSSESAEEHGMERCSTWAEAELQHRAMVEACREPGDEVVDLLAMTDAIRPGAE